MGTRLALFSFILLLVGCASNIPLEIRDDLTGGGITTNAVRADSNRYTGARVRWGGIIASVENKAEETWIEVVGKRLGAFGQPVLSRDQSTGRFLVRIDGFLDPDIYRKNRPITVFGTVEGLIVRAIDEYPYTYPLIRAQSYYLWQDYDYYPRYAHYPYPYGYYPYPYFYPYDITFGYHFGPYSRYHFGLHHHFHW